jgi:hypothetical protein
MSEHSKPGTACLLVEPFAGMAGDMFLAALLDLGDPRFELASLRELAQRLVGEGCELVAARAWRGSLSGLHLEVKLLGGVDSSHRGLAECRALIRQRSGLSSASAARAEAVFERIARAEAHVHGCAIEAVHFHEVGAIDALVDVCGAALALERLGVERVFSSQPLVGSGTVDCAHGTMPVPSPGTAEILRGRPFLLGGGPGERLTPTGAALLVELTPGFEPPGSFAAERIGYGAGTRDFEGGPPNVLRLQLGRVPAPAEPPAIGSRPWVWQLDFNVDDMSGEELGFLVERLRAAGCLEVWTHSVQMKKDRPGVIVTALLRDAARAAVERAAFAHSTTLGLRWSARERSESARESLEVRVLGRRVRCKLRRRAQVGGGLDSFDISPEYDDLAALAREHDLPLREVERAAAEAARALLG